MSRIGSRVLMAVSLQCDSALHYKLEQIAKSEILRKLQQAFVMSPYASPEQFIIGDRNT
jgi:hypothetical protein